MKKWGGVPTMGVSYKVGDKGCIFYFSQELVGIYRECVAWVKYRIYFYFLKLFWSGFLCTLFNTASSAAP